MPMPTSTMAPLRRQGASTMSPAMRSASNYARYLYSALEPWLSWPVLEIGTGFGTYTGLLLKGGAVLSIDIDTECLDAVHLQHPQASLTTRMVDLNDHESVRQLRLLGCRSLFCTNVLEHIEDDVGCLTALNDAFPSGGRACLIVPAHPFLYGYMDVEAGHYRRYTDHTLRHTLESAGWKVRRTFYLNALGAVGWLANHKLLPARPLDCPRVDAQLRLYDRLLVPLARWTDPLFGKLFGLSVAAVAEKD